MRSPFFLVLLLVAVLCVCAGGGFAQRSSVVEESSDAAGGSPSGAVSGTLVDPSGAAIANARVQLLGSYSKPIAQTTTNKTGYFSFQNVAWGKYTLQFDAEGFREASVTATISGEPASVLQVTLQILVQTESITVATGGSVPQVTTEVSENQN